MKLFDEEKAVRWANEVDQAGFTQIPNVVLRDATLSVPARLLYALFASFAWQEDACFPGQEKLAAMLGFGEKSIRRYTRELQDRQLIEVERVGLGHTNRYILYRPDRALETGLTGPQSPVLKKKEDTEKEEGEISEEEKKLSNDIGDVFSHWMQVMEKPANTRLTPERRKKIVARLKNYSVDEIKRAIDGCAGSDFNMGREPGQPQKWNDLTLICRNDTKLEEFRDMPAAGADPDESFFEGT